MSRNRAATCVGIALLALGLIDPILRFVLVGSPGLTAALQDPAKSFFHLVLLPLAAYLLVGSLPMEVVQEAFRRRRAVSVGTTLLLAIGVMWFWTSDVYDGFCTRLPTPSDLSNPAARVALSLERESQWSRVAAKEDELRVDPTAHSDGDAALARISLEAVEAYRARVAEYRGSCGEGWADYWSMSSIRSKWAAALSLIGLLTPVLLLWVLFLHAVSRRRVSKEFQEATLVIATLLTPWIVLRAYSEWWINFGAPSSYPYTLAVVLAVIVISLAVLLRTRPKLIVTAGSVATASTLVAAVAKWRPEWFLWVAREIRGLDSPYLFAVYVMLSLGIVAVLLASLEGDGENDESE